MRRVRRAAAVSGVVAVVGLVVSAGSTTAAGDDSGWTAKPVVGGLKLPRGVAFDRSGAMYVAETGLPGNAPMGVTNTGAVDKYTLREGLAHLSWSTPFLSLYDNGPHGAEALGPEGLTTTGCRAGDEESDGKATGCSVLMIMSESHQGIIDSGGPALPQFGHLYQLAGSNGAASDRGDIGDQDYAWANANKDVWSEFPDANPYGVLADRGRSHSGEDHASKSTIYVIDAGANTVNEVTPDGHAHVIAYIPNETPSPGLPTRDSTPTCAAEGPDGALYVGTLDLLRNFNPHQGYSHVYRIDPRAHEDIFSAAHLWASGLTTVTACTFDSEGNFWAAEMFKFNAAGPPGDVVRIPFEHPSQLEHVGGGHLPFPGGVAQGPDGAVYVTINSTSTSKAIGAVVRLSHDD